MEIRKYKKDDETAIMDLDARALPSKWNPRTIGNWHWKFTDKNPNGHSIIWVADHKEQILAHFAAVPYLLKTFDEEVRASHSIGALVELKYQNRGLLKLVGDKMLAELRERGISYTWGFPNKRAHKFECQALGYNDLLKFDPWVLKKDDFKQTPENPTIQPIETFGQEFDQLWEQCAPGYDVAIVRKKEYLNWRFLQRPDWDYYPFALYENNQLKGYAVYKLYQEEEALRGHIIDIFAQKDDEKTLSQLIDHGINFFIQNDRNEILIWLHGNPLIEKLFTQKGFKQEEGNIPLILKTNTDHEYKDKVLDKSNWYFTMSDSTEIF